MDLKFKNELDYLSEKSKNITNVLENTKDTFEKYFDDRFKDDYSCLNINTFPDIRLDNLDKVLTRLKTSLKLISPCVDQANEMVSKLNLLNTNVSVIKEKMKNVSVSNDILQLCDMEDLINDNYTKLKCVEKLQTHLDPSMFTHVNMDLDEDDDQKFVKIIQSAEKLKVSKKLCHSLKNIQELSESMCLSEALKRIDSNFDTVSQMCYMWLNKQTQKVSVLSSRLTSDSGIINEPLINVSDKDDKIGIVSIFEISSTNPNYTMDRVDVVDKPYGDAQNVVDDDNKEQEEVVDNRSLSLRILKILITNPKILQKILEDLNGFLSNLSIRRFNSLLQYIKLDLKYKNNAIYDVFMNLQLVLSLIKSCVLSLYYNCELDLYVNPYPDLDILTAPNYIDKITLGLVAPLEHKLDQILNINLGADDDLDLEMEFKSKLDYNSNANRLNNENQLNLDVKSNFQNGSQFKEYNYTTDSVDVVDKAYGDIYVGDILDLYAALQICHFYYKKISKLLKPPYLCPQYSSANLSGDSDLGHNEYFVDQNPVLLSFSSLCESWKDLISTKLQQNITYPLSSNEFSKKLNPDQVVETVSNFLSEAVSIQLEYSSSDDLLMILEMTLNPVINWCQKVSNELKEESQYFLIRSFSSLLNSIQSPQVNKSFKSLLEDLIDMSADVVSQDIASVVVSQLGGQLVDYSTFNVEFCDDDEFLEKIKTLVYTDSLKEHLPEKTTKTLLNLGTSNYRFITRRVYLFLAGVYKQHSEDKKLTDDLFTLASTYEYH